MDGNRFDALARQLTDRSSRRDTLRALVGVGIGLRGGRLSGTAEAKKKGKRKGKHKRTNKKAKPNAFGCLSVGKACKSAEQCCSGICQGKKGEKQCLNHGAGTCNQEAQGFCEAANPELTTCNNSSFCLCFRTTAGSNFCEDANPGSGSDCADCKKDADCAALGFPPGSACVPVSEGRCAGQCESGTGCLVPCGFEPPSATNSR